MPEFYTTDAIRRDHDATDLDVRLFLTFSAAMDRARDADRLWQRAASLFAQSPWVFRPGDVVARPLDDLRSALSGHGVSQRHGPDSLGWRRIAESLLDPKSPEPVRRAVLEGTGDAAILMKAVRQGRWYPFLRGPKISVMWVRMLAAPGRASIVGLDVLPVAVDVQVRKVTEYLDVTQTQGADWPSARVAIQEAWREAATGAVGPGPLDRTGAALDPALWFFGKWGCTFCERAGKKLPISTICARCVFSSGALVQRSTT